jgi:uncharacterized protein YbjT (DUF2867 family)
MDKGIVIAGATGEVGKRLVEKLIARNPNHAIHALVRAHSPLFDDRVQQHIVSYDELDTFKLPSGIYMAYSCLGTTIKTAGSQEKFKQVDHGLTLKFANWAHQHGCQNFACISAVGANKTSQNFYLSVKGQTEHDLTQIGFRNLWLIRPSLLLGQRDEFRLGEYLGALLSKMITPFIQGSLSKYRPVQMLQVAQTMATLMDRQDEKEGCYVIEGNALFKS